MTPDDRREGASPDPRRVHDRADLVRELGLLRSRAARGSGRARVSLDRIAAATGVPRSTVHAYLRGQRVPPPDVLDAIVLALDVSGAEAREWAEALYRVLAKEAARPTTKSQGGVDTPSHGRAVPRQLPAAVALIGRDLELAALDAAAGPCEVPRVLAVTGPGGIGKSALVALWAHRQAEQFPDGQIWLDLRGFGLQSPMTPAEALERMLRALGEDTSDLPPDADARAALFRTAAAGRRLLIVLDNARDSEQLRDLLPGEPGCCTVVTSRSELRSLVAVQAAQRLRLSRLDAVAGRALLGAESLAASSKAVDRITRFCEGLPLALRIANERLFVLGPAGVEAYLAELEDADRRLSALALPGISIRAVLRASVDALSADEQRVFAFLPLLHSASVELAALAALCGIDEQVARARCESLATANLLDRADAGTSRLHDLVAGFAAECLQAIDDASVVAARRRLLLHYAARADRATHAVGEAFRRLRELPPESPPVADFDSPQRAVAWVAETAPAIVAACAIELDEDLPSVVWALLPRVFWTLLYRQDVAVLMPVIAAAARRANELDRARDEAELCNLIGAQSLVLGRWHEAESAIERARTLARELSDSRAEARYSINLAHLARLRGDPRAAVEYAQRAVELHRDANRSWLWNAYASLSTTYQQLGDMAAHVSAAEESARLAEIAGSPDGLTVSTVNLAIAALNRGDLTAALTHAARAKRYSVEFANTDWLAASHVVLAAVLSARGQPEEALEQIACAAELYDGKASEEAQWMTITHGEILAVLGDRAGAAAQYQAAVDGSRGLSLFYYETDALVHLAELQSEAGRLSDARANARHALDIATEHGFAGLERKARELSAELPDLPVDGRPRPHTTPASST